MFERNPAPAGTPRPLPALLQLLWSESKLSQRRLLTLSSVAGLSNALVVVVINAASSPDRSNAGRLAVFVAACVVLGLYAYSQKLLMVATVVEVERVLHSIRVRVTDRVRRSELPALESIGRARLYETVNHDTMEISQATLVVAIGCQSAVLLLFASLYLAWLSVAALVLCVAGVALAAWVYFLNRGDLVVQMHATVARQNEFFDRLTHVLDGFKQVKLHAPRSRELFEHVSQTSHLVTTLKIATQEKYSELLIFNQVASYALVIGIGLALPLLGSVEPDTLVKTTAAVSFLLSPVMSLFGAVEPFSRADAAAQRIADVEAVLASGSTPPLESEDALRASFEHVAFRDVTFYYPSVDNGPAFSVGPIDLTFRRGETVFLVGGNGSGKSTLLLLLTGLYRPHSGRIEVDGVTVGGREPSHRSLFSTVFVDYHLFRRLYGLSHASPEQVAGLLERLQLHKKTKLVGRDFQNEDLSTGQKKRLALVVSLLEDRPIYVFDEWAADQDVVYRRFFYEELLPELRERGKTVIAVTHDDRWYHWADRVIEMRDGQVYAQRSRAPEGAS